MAFSVIVAICSVVLGGSLQAPPGMFKDLNDEILGDAIIINGKQLLIDNYIIEEIKGAEKILHQPRKHPNNPLMTPDQTWEKNGDYYNGTVMYDRQEKIFKMWCLLFWPPAWWRLSAYQLALRTPGMTPSEASFRRQILQILNFR